MLGHVKTKNAGVIGIQLYSFIACVIPQIFDQ